MKSYLYFFISILFLTSCSDDENNFEPQNEEDILQYINNNNLNASKTDSGIYYIINNEGSGIKPSENSVVNINYKGYFLDGIVFGQSESTIVDISKIIEGLKEGIQLLNEGGEGTIIIPSELAYGETGTNTIPGGAVIIFDIKLTIADYATQNDTAIQKYISENNLTATKTSSGLYYVINEEGTGNQPTSNSNVTVAYKGYFLNGSVFDQSDSNGISFGLNQVIAGWTEGIPYFKEGGNGILLIPFHLGYGATGIGTIPGGEVLVFNINLINVY